MVEPRLTKAELSRQWHDLFRAEKALLAARHSNSWTPPNGGPDNRSYLTGICLSGGGIRSATVCLGILQALAGARLVRHVDYMSSVSGGGYTASAVAFGYALGNAAADPDRSFPFGAVGPSDGPAAVPVPDNDQRRLLRFLRNHGNYLSQDGLVDTATGGVAVARALLLNLFLWVTLVGVALAALMSFAAWVMTWRVAGQPGHDPAIPACVILRNQCLGNSFFDALLFTAAMLAVALVALMIAFSLSSWRLSSTSEQRDTALPQWAYGVAWIACLAAAFVLALHTVGQLGQWGAVVASGAPVIWGEHVPGLAILLLVTLYVGGIALGPKWFTTDGMSRKYARRRYQENLAGRALLVILGLVVVGALPVFRDLLSRVPMLSGLAGAQGRGPLTALVYLVSLGAALTGYYRANLQGKLGLGPAFLVVAGSAFLCFGVLLLGYEVAAGLQRIVRAAPPFDWAAPLAGIALLNFADAFTLVAPIIALALGFFVNINDVGLGRYYRDRLMEAFMPDPASVGAGRLGAAPVADRFRLARLINRHGKDDQPSVVGPYPLINTNVMTHAFGDDVARRRRGDSFVLAPGHCGSTATGWRPTEDVIGGHLPLATAMATSGAAANPRGGFVGTGPTTNPVVALAMSLLSLRLGYWLRWSRSAGLRYWLNPRGNHFVPAASDFVGYPGAFVELTDGGHFENLGLYELVRRRCGLIVICDGGDDRSASYASFVSAARRIEEDFGATFSFEPGHGAAPRSGPQDVVARPTADEYPKDAEYSARGYFIGRVRYAPDTTEPRVPMAADGPSQGVVIYLKSAMIRPLSIVTRGYKGANADFPYESTADQFFSPEQFEAYRDVGIAITRQMLADTGLAELFEVRRPPLARLLRIDDVAAAALHKPPPPRAPRERPPPPA